ncbi:hypothetical protein BEN47_19355 [Hymenobacter lapidarius]|uniref:Uncharacterized protein n=1 Tax=Hymenobacter lapidarius TaxID=1908237 RepID=A0A1G1SRA2_9BACT|nr:hypothetical protein BEN47_19355 [Hymenobacter lapidarius]
MNQRPSWLPSVCSLLQKKTEPKNLDLNARRLPGGGGGEPEGRGAVVVERAGRGELHVVLDVGGALLALIAAVEQHVEEEGLGVADVKVDQQLLLVLGVVKEGPEVGGQVGEKGVDPGEVGGALWVLKKDGALLQDHFAVHFFQVVLYPAEFAVRPGALG